ncbi:hypothetical protein B0P06_006122 [Clostridium saccharoperbutylacetonicum]|uniref:Uncharacterized protein n=1 Tax=Clostridium saccharoperbutylacetonicum N1-4(HMT) TaxID=931276 RepID=M1MP17_9CLOT|nr:hypothetical protein [Clostridium saccharoperbutylacetonicum]AGF59604.1 hypothetical protein Cspa_135p00440 [Clostridium saccharoperbutylacetonicum N1-4(HMT)]NRT64539.1 hypothetical protein [Clostridium saccharoperbutylacetonicum]NSB29014.1 hypothetical protein [Clostridium saccharoperbutylacetonicum]NSB46229.1 hypothetical protein [Clostridium saccharoperbutylacetonicum]
MRKYLDQGGLVYYSNKLKDYLVSKVSKVQDDINSLKSKVDYDKTELEYKISNNTNIINQSIQSIQETNADINELDVKIKNLKTEVDDKPTYPITNINNVEQFVYKNVKINDVIEIPNNGRDTNYLIECYTEIDAGTQVECVSIDVNENNKDKLVYDENYIDIDLDGAKPKDTILLKFNKKQFKYNNETINVYESEVIPSEIVERFESIISIEEQIGVL